MQNNKESFTYFLGAGASAETIPTVKKFRDGILSLIVHLINLEKDIMPDVLRENAIQFYETFANAINKSASVDTYIKKLYLSNDYNSDFYKLLLSTYIHFETLTKESIDKRYDLFNASILEKVNNSIKIPDNINIVSWNYDRLYETSLQWIFGLNSDVISHYINIYSTGSDQSVEKESNKLNLVKLNGSAGGFVPIKEEHNSMLLDHKKELYRMIFGPLENPSTIKNHDKITFAWDKTDEVNVIRNKAIDIFKNTDHLIIIGYSFPTFNRELDFELLKGLKKSCKIHLQIPADEIKSVKQRLLSLTQKRDNDPNIFEHTETDEFYIPYEFNIPSKPTGPKVIGVF